MGKQMGSQRTWDHSRLTKCLVLGTWVIAASTVVTFFWSWHYMSRQLQMAEQSTRMQWRPFLHVEHRDIFLPRLSASHAEANEPATVFRPLDSVRISSTEWMSVRSIGFIVQRKVRLWNSGSTPLRVSSYISSTIDKAQWFGVYEKSSEKLARKARSIPEWQPFDHDAVVLLPDSVRMLHPIFYKREMDKSEFERSIDEDKELVLYPYTYIEYEDYFGNIYNVLRIDRLHFKVELVSGAVVVSDTGVGGLEQLRWDIELQ